MIIIATQGPERYLLAEKQDADPLSIAVILDLRQNKAFNVPLGSALARGYWEEWRPSALDDDILAKLDKTEKVPWPGG